MYTTLCFRVKEHVTGTDGECHVDVLFVVSGVMCVLCVIHVRFLTAEGESYSVLNVFYGSLQYFSVPLKDF